MAECLLNKGLIWFTNRDEPFYLNFLMKFYFLMGLNIHFLFPPVIFSLMKQTIRKMKIGGTWMKKLLSS